MEVCRVFKQIENNQYLLKNVITGSELRVFGTIRKQNI